MLPNIDNVTQSGLMPIRILVSYEWEKESTEIGSPLKPVRKHTRWKNISERVRRISEEVQKITDGTKAPFKCSIRVGRLRGLQGAFLLETLIDRIGMADILIADIGSDSMPCGINHNVLIELGMALGGVASQNKKIFILKPEAVSHPSDLNGFLFTDYRYEEESSTLKLLDDAGFRAALRSRMLEIARDRGMLGAPPTATFEMDEVQTP